MEKKQICTALGLPEAAEEAAVLVALQTAGETRTALQTAQARVVELEAQLVQAKTGTVSMTQYNDLQARLANVELDRKKGAAEAFVAQAIKDGKPIAEGVRETYIAMHVANPSQAEELINQLPSINTAGTGRTKKNDAGDDDAVEAMSAEDKAVCAKMGLEPKAFLEMRKKNKGMK